MEFQTIDDAFIEKFAVDTVKQFYNAKDEPDSFNPFFDPLFVEYIYETAYIDSDPATGVFSDTEVANVKAVVYGVLDEKRNRGKYYVTVRVHFTTDLREMETEQVNIMELQMSTIWSPVKMMALAEVRSESKQVHLPHYEMPYQDIKDAIKKVPTVQREKFFNYLETALAVDEEEVAEALNTGYATYLKPFIKTV